MRRAQTLVVGSLLTLGLSTVVVGGRCRPDQPMTQSAQASAAVYPFDAGTPDTQPLPITQPPPDRSDGRSRAD